MVAAGIPQLGLNKSATINQLIALCPDQSDFLRKALQYFTHGQQQASMTVKEFIAAAADADTPPELLSMWNLSCKYMYDGFKSD